MTIENIVQGVNDQLAGELLTYTNIRPLLNEVIDEINASLDACFPEFTSNTTEYNYFPDRYIRSVLIKGTAFKFYIIDEEGIPSAQQFNYNYQDALFRMVRDYLEDIPDEYKADHKASVFGLTDVASKPEFSEDYLL